jgi:hypothetical protein
MYYVFSHPFVLNPIGHTGKDVGNFVKGKLATRAVAQMKG